MRKSFDNFIDDLKRCHRFGITLYNFHPGSTVGKCSVSQSLEYIAESINRAHSLVPDVIVVLETMADRVTSLGVNLKSFEILLPKFRISLEWVFALIPVTYFQLAMILDLRRLYDKTMEKFESIIGFKYLKGVHLNDSKTGFNEGKDRHENIGKGKIGLNTFKYIMNDPRFDNIPWFWETPASESESTEIYSKEIELLFFWLKVMPIFNLKRAHLKVKLKVNKIFCLKHGSTNVNFFTASGTVFCTNDE